MSQLDRILDANRLYRALNPWSASPSSARPARQLVILTCMDTRLDLLRALGLEVGDAHFVRNAGGRATNDALRSIALSTKALGTTEIGVIHHDNCGLEGRTNDELRAATGVDLDFLPFADVEASVHDDVDVIRAWPALAPGTVVWGAVYDVDDASLRVVEQPG
jgi:carbonic anhydrase